jgi:cell division protease FtsH
MVTKSNLEAMIRRMLGGTLAEEIVFGDVSTGATSDLLQATRIASSMVKEYGMSRLGRVYLSDGEGAAFLKAMGGAEPRDHSEATAREVDLEVRSILDAATGDVRQILEQRRGALDRLANRLVESEVIDGSALREILEEPPA